MMNPSILLSVLLLISLIPPAFAGSDEQCQAAWKSSAASKQGCFSRYALDINDMYENEDGADACYLQVKCRSYEGDSISHSGFYIMHFIKNLMNNDGQLWGAESFSIPEEYQGPWKLRKNIK